MTANDAARPALGRLVRANQAGAFFALAVAISWGLWLPVLIALDPAAVTKAHLIPGAFGPAVAAALVTWLGGGSVRDWFTSCLARPSSRRWYLAALAAPVALAAAVGAVLALDAGTVDAGALTRILPLYPVALVVTLLVGGGQEEFGWRGFALPRLQARFDALPASLLLGGVWALWHLPLFAFEAGIYSDRSYPLYVPAVLAFSVLLTWQYNGSGGSVPVAMLLHAGLNQATSLAVPFAGGEAASDLPLLGVVAAVTAAAAALVVVRHGPETLAAAPAVVRETSGDAQSRSAARPADA